MAEIIFFMLTKTVAPIDHIRLINLVNSSAYQIVQWIKFVVH